MNLPERPYPVGGDELRTIKFEGYPNNNGG